MRITNQMMLARSLEAIGRNQFEMGQLERQIATGQRYQTLSEAPLDGRAAIEIDADLRAAGQHTRNIEGARMRLTIADATLDSVTGIAARAREVAIQQGGGAATPQSRVAAQLEVQALRDAVVQLANRRLNGAYVFGGAYSDLPPLDATGALDPSFPARGAPEYEIGAGVRAAGAHDAGQMFIDSDVVGSLDALDAALGANDPVAIAAAADRLRVTVANVQDLVTEVGARQVRLDMAEDNHTIVRDGLRTRRSVLMDTPLEEAVTRLAARRSAYQASLLATSRLLESSLVNFLR